jgi:hypothetical protein
MLSNAAATVVSVGGVTNEDATNRVVNNEGKDVRGGKGGKGEKSRCATCRAKLGLLPFLCRCGGAYCSSHISSVAHTCAFDYRAHQSKLLSEQLDTKGLHEKVEKI